MKIIPKNNPKCPYCNLPARKKGIRKTKKRITQRYYCKSCRKSFTFQPLIQKSKTYALKTILESINSYNLGQSLRTITKTNQIPKSTIHNWITKLKADLSFNRLRKNIKQNPIKKQKFIHHKQPFLYQYHQQKLQFAQKFPSLIQYLKTLHKTLPSFENTQRISQMSRTKFLSTPEIPKEFLSVSKQKYILNQKQNYATNLANIALQITKNNKERHNIIENFMLTNDTATIAVEIPVYLEQQNLTGHIDILQIRFHKIYLLDYKPEPLNKDQAITQLLLYRKALSQITNIKEQKFKLAFFNHKAYYECRPQD